MRVSNFGWLLLLSGCFTVHSVNIGTKTSLEKQLIGELEPLSEEELLAASIRASDEAMLAPVDELQARAVAARRRQLFNRDDIDELKASGCLGEARKAELVARPCKDAEAKERSDKLLSEENADRAVIIEWAVATDSSLTERDRGEVVEVYRRLLLERAQPGHWVQNDDGSWKQR
jgi:hypothetical protein